jgi:hypothetical protein
VVGLMDLLEDGVDGCCWIMCCDDAPFEVLRVCGWQ